MIARPTNRSAGSAPGPRRRRTGIAVGVLSVVGVASLADGPRRTEHGQPPVAHAAIVPAHVTDTSQRTWIEMQNVNLRVAENAVVGIRRLRGEVIPTGGNHSAFLDSTASFTIRITSGTVAIRSSDLGAILNRFVFGYRGSPLRKLRVRTDGSQLVQTGVDAEGRRSRLRDHVVVVVD